MITQILIRQRGGLYKLVDGEFQCQHEHVEWEEWTVYQPSQGELDMGTDTDLEVEGLVCEDCGEALYD